MVLSNNTIRKADRHTSKPEMLQGSLPGQIVYGHPALRSREKMGLFHQRKERGGEEGKGGRKEKVKNFFILLLP